MIRMTTFIIAATLAMPALAQTDWQRQYQQQLQQQRIYDNWQRDLDETRPLPYRPPVNCTSSRIGDMVFTSCY